MFTLNRLFRAAYANASSITLFSINTILKGPSSATQGHIAGKVIDSCTSYTLKELDKQREAAYYKNKPVKINPVSDFDKKVKIDFRPITKSTHSGIVQVVIDDSYVFEQEDAISSTEALPPLTKISSYEGTVSTVAKIAVSCLAAGVIPTATGIATGVVVETTVARIKDWGSSNS